MNADIDPVIALLAEGERLAALWVALRQTSPVSNDGALAEALIAAALDGLRDMQPGVIGFGEPEEGGAA
jgi:hypothetical protein